jgi:hypothetical protein
VVENGFTYRCTGTRCCELIDPDGLVFAWAIDPAWAGLIVGLLNAVEENGFPRPAPVHHIIGDPGPVEENGDNRSWRLQSRKLEKRYVRLAARKWARKVSIKDGKSRECGE